VVPALRELAQRDWLQLGQPHHQVPREPGRAIGREQGQRVRAEKDCRVWGQLLHQEVLRVFREQEEPKVQRDSQERGAPEPKGSEPWDRLRAQAPREEHREMQELRAGGLQADPPPAKPHQDQEPLELLQEEEPQAWQFPARGRKAKLPARERRAKESPFRHR
ncbi:uncharacterized protein METZ01_LOCUS318768, partial [marine metagenome]